MDTVWLYENGTYSAFDLVQKAYLSKSLAEIADAQQQEKVERTDIPAQPIKAAENWTSCFTPCKQATLLYLTVYLV